MNRKPIVPALIALVFSMLSEASGSFRLAHCFTSGHSLSPIGRKA
jgi:hypothetical protein